MFWKKNALLLAVVVVALILLGTVLWQNNQYAESQMRLDAANKDIVRLQNEVETWQERHATVEQALRDCQGQLSQARALSALHGQ